MTVQILVRRVPRRPGSFHDQAVHLAVDHALQDRPLRPAVVIGRAQVHHGVVLVQHLFNSLHDRGKDIVRNIGRHHTHMDRALAASRSVADVRSAAPPPVNQTVLLQQGNRLPDRLAGYTEADPQLFFCHQGLSVPKNLLRNLPAQDIRHLLILRLFRHSKHILSGMLFLF